MLKIMNDGGDLTLRPSSHSSLFILEAVIDDEHYCAGYPERLDALGVFWTHIMQGNVTIDYQP